MVKKLTIAVDEEALVESYRQMAADELHEQEAEAWIVALEGETWAQGEIDQWRPE